MAARPAVAGGTYQPCPALPPRINTPCRPGTRVAVLERSDIRPRGAMFTIAPNGVRAMEAIAPELRAALAAHHTAHLIQRRYTPDGELTMSTDKGDAAARILEHGPMITLPWHALQVRSGGR